jgi:RimJ/RimL family protein N-acetyltransferase
MMIMTARTMMRPVTKADAEVWHSWRSDAEVMRYTPFGPDPDLAATIEKIERAIAYDEQHGFSKWLVLDRATGEAIGDAGLLPMPGSEDFELGYRLRRDQWGKGLATEIALGWIEFARDRTQLSHLVAFARHDHAASQRVLEKAGFRRAGEVTVYGMPSLLYRVELRSGKPTSTR